MIGKWRRNVDTFELTNRIHGTCLAWDVISSTACNDQSPVYPLATMFLKMTWKHKISNNIPRAPCSTAQRYSRRHHGTWQLLTLDSVHNFPQIPHFHQRKYTLTFRVWMLCHSNWLFPFLYMGNWRQFSIHPCQGRTAPPWHCLDLTSRPPRTRLK